MTSFMLIFLLFIMGFANASETEPASVKVIALFSNKAMLEINGQNIIMQKGDIKQGVTLISASGRGAVVRFESGVEQTLELNQSIQQAYKKPQNKTFTVYSDSGGMFVLQGKINGLQTEFLLDTGASSIALSSDEADKLRLPYKSGRKGAVQTASEVVPVWHVKLDRVEIGGINVPSVDAVVLKGSSPQPVLLGMSFLKHLKLQRNGAAMIIEQKY